MYLEILFCNYFCFSLVFLQIFSLSNKREKPCNMLFFVAAVWGVIFCVTVVSDTKFLWIYIPVMIISFFVLYSREVSFNLFLRFLLGSFVFWLIELNVQNLLNYNYNVFYTLIPTFSLLSLFIFLRLFGEKCFVFLRQKKIRKNLHAIVVLGCGNKMIKKSAYYDTGNRVFAKNGEPVIMVSSAIYNSICSGSDESIVIETISGFDILSAKSGYLLFEKKGKKKKIAVKIARMNNLTRNDIILHQSMGEVLQ